MDNPAPAIAAAELKAMQDSIYREKILRARRQTPEERLADVFELSDAEMMRMHHVAMLEIADSADDAQGWEVVKQRIELERKMRDAGRFVSQLPSGQSR
jgi:hypothetical protein